MVRKGGWGRMTKLADVLPDSDTVILALNAIANINHYSCASLDININYASVLKKNHISHPFYKFA